MGTAGKIPRSLPPTLAERIRWAEQSVEHTARSVVAHPNATGMLTALASRLRELDALRAQVQTSRVSATHGVPLLVAHTSPHASPHAPK